MCTVCSDQVFWSSLGQTGIYFRCSKESRKALRTTAVVGDALGRAAGDTLGAM
jgi:hypothetical protein